MQGAGYFLAALGVGTVANAGVAGLYVLNNSTAAAINATQSGSGPSAVFIGGNVGIGTALPADKLDVAGAVKVAGTGAVRRNSS